MKGNKMKSIAELNAEHSAAIAKLEAEHALASLMPAAPDSVQLGKGRRPSWIVYRKRSLSAALELMELFHCVPLYRYKGTFTELTPDGCADERSEETGGPFAFALDVNQGAGYGPSVQIYFYAGVSDPALAPQSRLVRVVIDIDGPDYIGAFSALGASFIPVAWTPRRNEPSEWRVGPCAALSGLADSYVQWASGSKKACRFTYLFCADQAEAMTMTANVHALDQLCNLRDEFQPAAELIESTARADYYRIPGVKGARDCFAAVKPGAPAPANVAGYYSLETLKRLKGDA
jgi:hypothetical protein